MGGTLPHHSAGRIASRRGAVGASSPRRRCHMYATMRRYEGVTDPAETGSRVDQGFVPLIREIPGFHAYYWVDAGDGNMASFSVFDDQAGAEASTDRAAGW